VAGKLALLTVSDLLVVSLYNERELKVRDLARLVEADGWRHVRTTGSHRHYKHASKPNVVTIPGHPGDDVPTGTLKSILKAAGLEKKP
jgi:predicted RNA binding protein YcfA (HicA-like mRNA interferase family)